MDTPPTSPHRFARSGSELLQEIRHVALGGLSRALRRSLAGAIDELLDRLVKAQDWDLRKEIGDGLDLLRNGREGIEIRFDRASAAAWDSRTRKPGSVDEQDREEAARPPPVLSLIDDTMISDQLQISRIAGRARRRMDEEQVDGMRARFGAMLGRDWFADNDFPVAPDVVLESLRDALGEFGQPRSVFYLLEIFEPKISADLVTLYADLNAQLIGLGVLPEIRYRIVKTGGGSTPASARPSAEQGGGQTDRVQAAADAFDEPVFTSNQPIGAPALGERFTPALPPGAVVLSNEAALALADQLRQRLPAAQASATRYLSDPTRFGAPGNGEAARPASESLLEALSSLQADLGSAGGGAEAPDMAGLIDAARARSAEVAEAHGSPLERMIIETVSLIFEQVYTDDEIADAVKQQLLRLQVAAFKSALIDPSFFARPEHPMRQVIERISAIGSDPDYETRSDSPLTLDLAELVGWILETFERDLAIFETALTRLDAMVDAEDERRDQRLARIAEAAEKAERHEAARQAIRQRLLVDVRADVPDFIRGFLSDPWSETVARIQAGAGHPPFDENRAVRAAEQLLWSIAPKAPADIGRLAAVLPQLIADLSRGLAYITLADADRELFFSELLALHGSTIEQAKRNRPAAVVRKPVVPAEMPAPALVAPALVAVGPDEPGDEEPATEPMTDPVTEPLTESLTKAPQASEPADAVTLLRLINGSEVEMAAADGTAQRYKLGWMSPARSVFIFTRFPREHRTIRRAQMNQMVREGRLRVLTRTPTVGAAIESLLKR